MKRFSWMILLGCIPMGIGCGKATPTADEKDKSTSVAKGEPITEAAETVAQFLDSARKGDETTVSNLLTEAAKSELKKYDMEVAPPGAPDANFQIGGTRFTDDAKDAAFVEISWSEPNETTKIAEPVQALIAVRKEPAGWRIAGMMVAGKDGSGDQFVDFENLADQMAPANSPYPPAGAVGTPNPAASQGPSMAVNAFAQPNIQANVQSPTGNATQAGFTAPNTQNAPGQYSGSPYPAPAAVAPQNGYNAGPTQIANPNFNPPVNR